MRGEGFELSLFLTFGESPDVKVVEVLQGDEAVRGPELKVLLVGQHEAGQEGHQLGLLLVVFDHVRVLQLEQDEEGAIAADLQLGTLTITRDIFGNRHILRIFYSSKYGY